MINVDNNQLTEEQVLVVQSLDELSTTPAGQHIAKNADGSFSNTPDTGSGGGTPSDTVGSQTTYGQSSNPGVSTEYSRGDHTHGTPALPTKSDIGLGNVDNTSDANKPVSTATQTALNAKQDTLVSGTNIKTINGTSVLGSGNIVISGGSGTKGIAEVDFGNYTVYNDIATVTVVDAAITTTSYPSVSMYAIATTDHDPDDYMVEGLIPYVTNVVNGVSFDISVRAPSLTWGKYKVTYQY